MELMKLAEKYRPKRFEDVLGQDAAIRSLQTDLASSGWGGKFYWISGASGIGKTTIARILARQGADEWFIREYDSADQLTSAELDDIDGSMYQTAWGLGGRAYIVNEAHALRAPAIRRLLGIQERLPAHVVFIFTTTKLGEEKLFEDSIEESPLLTRCTRISLTNQGLSEVFAARGKEIAMAEGLDGRPLAQYVRAVREEKNSMRGLLARIQAGVMKA